MNKKVTYSRGLNEFNERVLNVNVDGKFVCYIQKCDVLNEYFAWRDAESDYICGGLTLKECKEVLERMIQSKDKIYRFPQHFELEETLKNAEHKDVAEKMYNEIWDIFSNYGGYDYNDSMLCQAQGSSGAWDIYEKDEDWDGLIKELTPCLDYMRHIKKIRILQESIPQEIYC
jgi:hypothetical protein